jgi:glycosyltransferase involved in cell wall biosynthesis
MRGGAERCFFDLTHLLEMHGHKVIPFSMEDDRNHNTPYARYFISNVDFPSQLSKDSSFITKVRLAQRVIYSREAKRKVKALIDETKPDIAHVHGIAHETSPSILPAIKGANIPIVQTLHDYKLLCPNTNFVSQGEICERCKQKRYFNVVRYRCKRNSLSASLLAGLEMYVHKILKIYERNVDLFICPSDFLHNKLTEFGMNVPTAHLPNFIQIDNIEPCYEKDDYFVFSGRLVGVKGVKTLLAAMQRVKESHLYVAGAGELEADLKAFLQEHEIKNVTFLGHLNTHDLMALVQRALFTVVPSEWYENYPMTVLESYACGTPVIGSRIGGIPEVVQDGISGLLFEPGNETELAEKILYMLHNRGQAITMGRKGRAQVEKTNSPEQYYKSIMEIYRSLATFSPDGQVAEKMMSLAK